MSNSFSSDIQPLVSVITPSFNDGEFIMQNIQSVKNQSWGNIEHIIFDGQSTDNTINLLKTTENVLWFSEPDRGQSHALNKGFEIAKGEYIAWLNSDDSYTSEAISRSVKYLSDNKDVDMIYTDVNIIDENDLVYGVSSGDVFSLKNLLINNPVKQPGAIFRKSIIDKIGGLDENLNFTMDRYFWLKIVYNGFNIKYIPNWINANFRLIEGTKSFSSVNQFKDEWLNILKSSNECKEYKKKYPKIIKKAIAVTQSSKYLFLMNSSFSKRKFLIAFGYAIKCILSDLRILFNFGFYKLFFTGVILQEYTPARRYLSKTKRHI